MEACLLDVLPQYTAKYGDRITGRVSELFRIEFDSNYEYIQHYIRRISTRNSPFKAINEAVVGFTLDFIVNTPYYMDWQQEVSHIAKILGSYLASIEFGLCSPDFRNIPKEKRMEIREGALEAVSLTKAKFHVNYNNLSRRIRKIAEENRKTLDDYTYSLLIEISEATK